MRRPELTIAKILRWADIYQRSTGKWPNRDSGRIPGSLGETWTAIDLALKRRGRGLSVTGMSLRQLLAERRKVRNHVRLPNLSIGRIQAWALEHKVRTGLWPTDKSGPIQAAQGESWAGVDYALRKGKRGLPGGSSVFRVLVKQYRIRHHRRIPEITVEQILVWAKAHRTRFGKLPAQKSGTIPRTGGITWNAVDRALADGCRGLPGGSSLPRLLRKHLK